MTDRPHTVVMLCRDCCCGTATKHPHTDHGAQVAAFEALAAEQPGLRVKVVDCLDVCERSNVVLVRRPGLPKGQRDTWIGGVTTERATADVLAWVRAGAGAALPQAVASRRFAGPQPGR